jgi:hypothetical protein
MKVSAEIISGTPATIIRHPFSERVEWVRAQLALGVPVVVEDEKGRGIITRFEYCETWKEHKYHMEYSAGNSWILNGECFTHTVQILPALPRNPTPDDAGLLYRYASEGLTPVTDDSLDKGMPLYGIQHGKAVLGFHISGYSGEETGLFPLEDLTITHAVLANGTRVEVAFREETYGEGA